jgi:NADPH:quinone reductase-like Zn-dependent oxidoreductase
MRGFVSTGDSISLVALETVAEPEPGSGEAVVAVEGYSLNRGEVLRLTRQGAGAHPGQDVAGRVLRAAADGSGPREGTRVVGHVPAGSWSERVAVPTAALAVLPDAVELEAAAALPMAGLTALRLVRLIGGRLVGRRVLLTGAGGGVGHGFVELASAVGARVTAVTTRSGERLLRLGAAEAVTAIDDASGPYDVIVESIGGQSLTASWQLVSQTGLIVWMGQAGGAPATLDFFSRVGPGVNPTIARFSYWPADEPDGPDLAALVRLVAADRLHPEVGEVASWERTPEMLQRFLERRTRGNVVLLTDGAAV